MRAHAYAPVFDRSLNQKIILARMTLDLHNHYDVSVIEFLFTLGNMFVMDVMRVYANI